MNRLPRLGLVFVAAAAILTGLLANTPVFAFPVALAIGVNVAAAFAATIDLRHTARQRASAGRLAIGLFTGGVVVLIAASALVTPGFIEELDAEARLPVQLLVLSTGFAAALLAWWGREWIGREHEKNADGKNLSDPHREQQSPGPSGKRS